MFGSFPGSLGRTTNQVYRCEGADAVMGSKERHKIADGTQPWVNPRLPHPPSPLPPVREKVLRAFELRARALG
jgi:hypothetical protein